jgi:hypothetical protein
VSFPFPVEAGHVLMFARALGDETYGNPTHPRARTAPPTFVAAVAQFDPEWAHRPRPGEPWRGSGAGPGTPVENTGGGTSLHAEQHYEYHRAVRAGEVLTVERSPGRSWQKQSSRAGLLRFEEEVTTFTDTDGKAVCTATRVRVITEKPVQS